METMWHSHPWHFAPTWNLSTAHTSNAKKWNQDPEDLAGNHWDSTQQLYEMWSNSNWRTFTYPAYFGKLLLLALEESPGWATTGMILKLSWMSWIGGSFRDLLPRIQRLCLTKDGAERKWGSRMGHACSSLSCVNHPIGKPKELTQTYGVWNVEAAWIRIRKDLGLGFYQWLSKE